MSDLNPCPFCGGEAAPTAHLQYSWFAPVCKSCGARGPYVHEGAETRATMEEAADEIERLREEIGRLLDSREREGDRLDWLLSRLPGSVIRDLVGVMNDTRDAGEWRDLIDKAACFAPHNAG